MRAVRQLGGDTRALIEAAAELAEKHDVRLTTHLSQFPGEESWSLERFGLRPVDWFESVGWASIAGVGRARHFRRRRRDRAARSVGHGRRALPDDLRADRRGCRAGAAMRRRASTSVSLRRRRLRARLDVARGAHRAPARAPPSGPTSMSARDVLEMATLGSARCLGRQGENGFLAAGACGDVVAWPLEGVRLRRRLADPVEAWLRCGPVRSGIPSSPGGRSCETAN